MAGFLGKVLFDVKLPATGLRYDFWVPRTMAMGKAASLIAEAMAVIEPDFFASTGREALMYIRTGQLQDPGATAGEIGFSNGEQFMLI